MDLLEFSQRHPWKPAFPAAVVHRFTTELISTPEMILPLRDVGGWRALAVLLDAVENPANDACFEFLGLRPGEDERACARALLAQALARVPAHRSGVQVGVPEGSALDSEFFSALGFVFHYGTYEMDRTVGASEMDRTVSASEMGRAVSAIEMGRAAGSGDAAVGLGFVIERAVPEDADEIYAVLKESFARNPETSMPAAEAWRTRFLAAPGSRHFVLREGREVLGFAQLGLDPEEPDTAEVRMIGVLPRARNRGFGAALLRHCLHEAEHENRGRARLTVAAANDRALELYRCEGFVVTERYLCYRRPRLDERLR